MVYLPKTAIAHPCLETEKAKASGTYYCGQVLETLKKDFKNKCYICETKEPHAINIEHFEPHGEDVHLKFDWNNLFYCCWHCNSTKRELENILNCTVEQDGVDTKIKYEIDINPRAKAKITALENTDKVNNTVKLLNDVYNETTEVKLSEAENIRKSLLSEMRRFGDLLFRYDSDSYDEDEKNHIKNEIIRELRVSSGYTAFKRWIIRENEYPDFIQYI